VIALVATAAGLAGAYNVLSDNSELRARAQRQACEGTKASCRSTLTRLARSPFAQEFDFRVGARSVRLRCTRSLLLVGPHDCTRSVLP
jgi:hypothetical protein